MKTYIDQKMTSAKISKKNYNVIHVRCPDEVSFPPLKLNPAYVTFLQNEISKHINPSITYLLLTNNHNLKTYLSTV